jgi:hypothetical protein
MIDGTADCLKSHGSISWLQKLPFVHSHGKSTVDVGLLVSGDPFKEVVISEPCGLAVFPPALPQPRVVGLCSLLYCGYTGSPSSSNVT